MQVLSVRSETLGLLVKSASLLEFVGIKTILEHFLGAKTEARFTALNRVGVARV
jgi:hypothetical protein